MGRERTGERKNRFSHFILVHRKVVSRVFWVTEEGSERQELPDVFPQSLWSRMTVLKLPGNRYSPCSMGALIPMPRCQCPGLVLVNRSDETFDVTRVRRDKKKYGVTVNVRR